MLKTVIHLGICLIHRQYLVPWDRCMVQRQRSFAMHVDRLRVVSSFLLFYISAAKLPNMQVPHVLSVPSSQILGSNNSFRRFPAHPQTGSIPIPPTPATGDGSHFDYQRRQDIKARYIQSLPDCGGQCPSGFLAMLGQRNFAGR